MGRIRYWAACIIGWVVQILSWMIFGIGYLLYNYLIEPACWLIYAPGSVYMGARDIFLRWLHHGKEPGDK